MESVFRNINKFAGKHKELDFFAIFCARFLPYLMVITMLGFLIWQKHGMIFIFAMASGGLGRLLNEVGHILYKKQRPAYIEGAKVLIPVPKNLSFPSGHSSFLFGASFLLLLYFRELGLIFVALSFLVGLARVYCGVHWFRDILGGILMGFVSAIIINYLINLWI